MNDELVQVKAKIAAAEADLTEAKAESDFERRDRLESYLLELQKKENILECLHVSSVPQNSVACFSTPVYSPSRLLCRDDASVYDVFFHPCGPEAYMPNLRLATISSELYVDLELNSYEYDLRDLLFPDCWVDAPCGTETNISDKSVRKVIDLVAKRMKERHFRETTVRSNKPGFKMVMASKSKSEHYINTTTTGGFEVIVIVSEAKGIESSSRTCMLQFLRLRVMQRFNCDDLVWTEKTA
jgi:hypothetical protein